MILNASKHGKLHAKQFVFAQDGKFLQRSL